MRTMNQHPTSNSQHPTANGWMVLVVMLAVVLMGSGCTTTTVGGRMVAGIDLLSVPSYEVRGWVPQTPVVRQVCMAADYYAYSWQNTPWQTLTAHLAVLLAGEKQGWWEVLPDQWTGDEAPAGAPPRAVPLANATVVLTATGDNNSIAYTYAGSAPVIDVALTGDGNHVSIMPQEDEE